MQKNISLPVILGVAAVALVVVAGVLWRVLAPPPLPPANAVPKAPASAQDLAKKYGYGTPGSAPNAQNPAAPQDLARKYGYAR